MKLKADELTHTREMLDRRFDDLESGRVKPIDGEETYRRLMEKTETQRQLHLFRIRNNARPDCY